MYIKSIKIVDSVANEVLRQVHFHMGANLVCDMESSESHNKVGKTTFLKLIDVLMGANNKKLLYTDYATNTVNTNLQNIIINRKITAEMELTDVLEDANCPITALRVDLYPKGHYFINDKRLSAAKYRRTLNDILFGIDDNVPTFRQLITSFVRVAVSGDNDKFLRTLPHGDLATYRAIYNHLFNISDPRLDQKLRELKHQQQQTSQSLSEYKRINGVESSEKQEQILAALEIEYSRLKAQADDIIDAEEYCKNRQKFSYVRKKYAELLDIKSEVDYRIQRNKAALAGVEAEKEKQVDLELAKRFYYEVESFIPSLEKTFEQMISFNKKLCENRIEYFNEAIHDLTLRRLKIENQISDLLARNGHYLSLVTNNRINEYHTVLEELERSRQSIGQQQQIVESLKKYDADLARTAREIERYSTGGGARADNGKRFKERMDSFNQYFKPTAYRINGEKPILVYSTSTDEFPVSIADIDGSSTGTRKSLLAAYDLAYQQFARENDIKVPHFIVHDVVENIEGDDFNAILETANNVGCQYIIAVLKEKLDSSDIPADIQEKSQILVLSSEDKFFDGKTVKPSFNKLS